MIKMIIVMTLSEDNQYSGEGHLCERYRSNSWRSFRTKFPICPYMNSIDTNQEDPKHQTDDPRMLDGPELKDQLCSGKIRCNRNRIVEPIVPGQRKAVRWRKESGSVCVEGACHWVLGSHFA